MKIRTKLTLQYFLITAGIMALAFVFIYQQFKQHVETEFFKLLESKARMTAEMVLQHEEELKPINSNSVTEDVHLPYFSNTSIFNKYQQCVFSLNKIATQIRPEVFFSIDQNGIYRFSNNKLKAIGVKHHTSNGNTYISISEEIPDFGILTQLRNILLICFLIVVCLVVLGGWFFAGEAMRPVSNIVNQVDKLLPSDLSQRLHQKNQKDELSHLIQTVNSLLNRIEYAFQMQKSFIANVSHELKNPLAAIQAQLQMTRHKTRSVGEYNDILSSLQEDVSEMVNTMEKLLQLARVHSDQTQIAMHKVRLDELIYEAREMLIRAQPNYNVKFEIQNLPSDDENLIILSNEALLVTAFYNLMENGCKFSPEHQVKVRLEFNEQNDWQINFCNQGSYIPPDEIEKIFQAFYRSPGQAHKKGTGIGLHLVQSILRIHQIKMHVKSDLVQGTEFILRGMENNKGKEIPEPRNKVDHAPKAAFSAIQLLLIWMTFIGLFCGSSCRKADHNINNEQKLAADVIADWYNQYILLDWNTDGYRPPVSARMWAYVGLAGWECGVAEFPDAMSFGVSHPEFSTVAWTHKIAEYNLPAALNESYYELAHKFFPHANMIQNRKIEMLYQKYKQKIKEDFKNESVLPSGNHGKEIAEAVYQYSSTDSNAHMSFLYNYDPNYHPPSGPGKWQPTGTDQMPPLLPHWKKTRWFFVNPNEISSKNPVEYSSERSSGFFAQAWEIFNLSQPITEERRWIAEFWSDDFTGVSFCAATRWLSIQQQLVKQYRLPVVKILESNFKIGLALNDAAVKVWTDKYFYSVERPETFIRREINPEWEPLHHTPPFPAYPSGHSAFGASATQVMMKFYGEEIDFMDRSHEGRKEFVGTPRHFTSFSQMAKENALSRMYIGVHFRMDCEEGLRLGKAVGERVAAIQLYRDVSRK